MAGEFEIIDSWMQSQKEFMDTWMNAQKELWERLTESTRKMQEALMPLCRTSGQETAGETGQSGEGARWAAQAAQGEFMNIYNTMMENMIKTERPVYGIL